jgi:hypothetical protein
MRGGINVLSVGYAIFTCKQDMATLESDQSGYAGFAIPIGKTAARISWYDFRRSHQLGRGFFVVGQQNRDANQKR